MTKSKGQLQVDFLKSVIAAGGKIVKASFSIESDIAPSNPAYLLTLDQGGALSLQELPWTQELEEYLLHERPTRTEEEPERFANIIGNNLKALGARFGRDYAQAVFVEYVSEHPEYGLGQMLPKIPTYAPSHDSSGYRDCRLLVENSIKGLQNTVAPSLGYADQTEVLRLICKAIGIVLDNRFFITLRSKLFPG